MEEIQIRYSLLNEAPHPFFSIDARGNFITLNKAACRLIGYSEKELIGKSFSILLPKQEYVKAMKLFKTAAGGKMQPKTEMLIKTKDGKLIPIELFGKPITKKGKVTAIIGTAHDLTKRKKLERKVKDYSQKLEKKIAERTAELRTTKDRLQRVLESSSISITVADNSGKIIIFNKGAEKLTGYKAKETIGKSISMFYPEKIDYIDLLNQLEKNGKIEDYETIIINKKGNAIPISISISQLKDTQGKIFGSIGIALDITERKEAEEELTRLADLKSNLIRDVSHELKNPLTTMRLTTDLLLSKCKWKDNEAEHALKMLSRTIDSLKETVTSILDYSKIQEGKIVIVKTSQDLIRLTDEVIEEIKPIAVSQNIEIIKKHAASELMLPLDKEEVKKVIRNLLDNAMKFDKTGPITVSVSKREKYAVVAVKDRGRGINPTKLKEVFSPFFKEHAHEKGTGIGLSICKGIVERHRGKISCRSKGRGKGTTFTFTLPL